MSSDVPHPNMLMQYSTTRNANAKKTKKTGIGHMTMNIQEACGLIWTNGPRAVIICLFTMWISTYVDVEHKDLARLCCLETVKKPFLT